MLDVSDTRRAFSAYLDRLIDGLTARPDVTGLVLAGSTADRARVDEWSDHDFLVTTVSEQAAETMRTNLAWLPDAETLVIAVREGAHGLKCVYENGAMLEFAVFAPGELLLAHANDFEVALDRGGIGAAMREVAAKPKPLGSTSPEAHAQLFLAHLLIGVGRARRGELLSAGQSVRSHALGSLLALHRMVVVGGADARLDDLDAYRRLETVHPDFAALLERALERDPERAARSLLYLAVTSGVTGWRGWPIAAERAVRERLGWPMDAPQEERRPAH